MRTALPWNADEVGPGVTRCGCFSIGALYVRCELAKNHAGKHVGTNDDGSVNEWDYQSEQERLAMSGHSK